MGKDSRFSTGKGALHQRPRQTNLRDGHHQPSPLFPRDWLGMMEEITKRLGTSECSGVVIFSEGNG
jgi:hypothetical protein